MNEIPQSDEGAVMVNQISIDDVDVPLGGNTSGSDLYQESGTVQVRLPEPKRDQAIVMLRRARDKQCETMRKREEADTMNLTKEWERPEVFTETRKQLIDSFDPDSQTCVLDAKHVNALSVASINWQYDYNLPLSDIAYIEATVNKAQKALFWHNRQQ